MDDTTDLTLEEFTAPQIANLGKFRILWANGIENGNWRKTLPEKNVVNYDDAIKRILQMREQPNVVLITAIKPDDLPRKTMRNILSESGTDLGDWNNNVKIGASRYSPMIIESDYDDDMQVSADEGDLVFCRMTAHDGYGGVISWDELEMLKKELEEWSLGICERHNCTHKIYVTANHW